MPSCLRATFTAWKYFPNPFDAHLFLDRAEAALFTTLPSLFFISCSLVIPPAVFSFRPLNTLDRALFPRAILLTFIAFIAFITFIAFIAFFAFIAAFIAFIDFIARAPRIAAF